MTAQQAIYTVSQLNSEVKYLLEHSFATLCLLGEVSNLVQAQSGHRYFSLKDGNAQVRCAFFRNTARKLDIPLENGQQILVHANISLYEARGEFQLIVNQIEAVGDGALQLAFEQLKRQLAGEGLFAAEHKRPLPRFPQTIGVITSASGAAIRDVLKVLKRRCPSINVIIYPTLVQGAQAARQIAAQIDIANQRQECELLLLTRGGGSLEDLWAFNEEVVARAVFNSQLPIISGIGHEIDFTIADFVADQRAATPSAAAEQISPDSAEWQKQFSASLQRLSWLVKHQLQSKKQSLINLQQRLRHPQQQLDEQQKKLKERSQQLITAIERQLSLKQQRDNQRH
jgi:exodeoxyribonuclease VII large subunit